VGADSYFCCLGEAHTIDGQLADGRELAPGRRRDDAADPGYLWQTQESSSSESLRTTPCGQPARDE
jgi:hypothetical protein